MSTEQVAQRDKIKIFTNWINGGGGVDRMAKLTKTHRSTIYRYLAGEEDIPEIWMIAIREGEKYAEERKVNAQQRRDNAKLKREIEGMK